MNGRGLQQEFDRLQQESRSLRVENMHLKEQLRRNKMADSTTEEEQEPQGLVQHKSRSTSRKTPAAVATQAESLPQLRKVQRSTIMALVKKYAKVLVPFNEIMKKSLLGRKCPEFLRLHSVHDFSDGFAIAQGHCSSAKSLQAYIKGHRLESHVVRCAKRPGYFFVHQKEGPFTVGFMLEAVRSAAGVMEQKLVASGKAVPEPIVAQLDITRDLKGTFYVVDDWPGKHA